MCGFEDKTENFPYSNRSDRGIDVSARCLPCKRKADTANKAKRYADPEKRKQMNATTYRGRKSARQRGTRNAQQGKRRATLLKQTPAWSENDKIKEIYAVAHRWGLHVDHHYPLNGKTVSGLHVFDNLRLLTPEDNLKKSNHVPEETPRVAIPA